MSIVHLVSPFCRLIPRNGNFTATKTGESKPNSKLRSYTYHMIFFLKRVFLRTQPFVTFFLICLV